MKHFLQAVNLNMNRFLAVRKNINFCFSEEEDHEYELIFKDGAKYIGNFMNSFIL